MNKAREQMTGRGSLHFASILVLKDALSKFRLARVAQVSKIASLAPPGIFLSGSTVGPGFARLDGRMRPSLRERLFI
jgi:hypothetical protein